LRLGSSNLVSYGFLLIANVLKNFIAADFIRRGPVASTIIQRSVSKITGRTTYWKAGLSMWAKMENMRYFSLLKKGFVEVLIARISRKFM
jgi:hypothetical protein